MEAGAGGGHKHTATHADADAPSCPPLTQQTSSSSSLFDKVLLQQLPLTNIHRDPHYSEPEDTQALLTARTDFTETLLPLVLCTLYICPLLLFPSLLPLICLPLPSFSYNQPGLLPPTLPFLLWVAARARWLTDNASAGECWEWGQGSGLQWPQEGGSVYTPSRLWLHTRMLTDRKQQKSLKNLKCIKYVCWMSLNIILAPN